MRKTQKFGILFFIFLVLSSFVYAVPPQTVFSDGQSDLKIKIPPFNTILEGRDFEFEFHVFNKSNGVPLIEGIDCFLHIYNSSGKHIYEGVDSTPSHTFDYSFDIRGTNFTHGTYGYIVSCNNSERGGFTSTYFDVTKDGRSLDTYDTRARSLIIGLGILSFILLFIAFNVDKDHYLLKLLCLFFSMFPLLLMPNVLLNPYSANTSFLKLVLMFFRILVVYFFLYFNWVLWIKSKLIDFGVLKQPKPKK